MSARDPARAASTTSPSGSTSAQPLADFLCDHLGMHVIEETDTFTLVGVDAKLGKLTLFDAEGPRERGSLEHIALRVGDLTPPSRALPEAARPPAQHGDGAGRGARAGCRWLWWSAAGSTSTSTTWCCGCPTARRRCASSQGMGFERRGGALAVGDRELRIVEGDAADGERPLLNHLALLVDSADEVQRDAEERGVEIDDIKDAPNTLAVFLRGPSGVRIEYVEHKPGFALV